MALRLGIGDTLTICKGAIDYCSRNIHDEPEDARILIADMCPLRSHLVYLSKYLGDEYKFAAARPEVAPSVQRSLASIQRDLTEIEDFISEDKRKPSLHIVDQKLPVHRKSISEIMSLIDAQTHGERKASIVKLDELAQEQEGLRKESVDGWNNDLLWAIDEHASPEDERDVDEVSSGMQQELLAKGHHEARVEGRMCDIRSA